MTVRRVRSCVASGAATFVAMAVAVVVPAAPAVAVDDGDGRDRVRVRLPFPEGASDLEIDRRTDRLFIASLQPGVSVQVVDGGSGRRIGAVPGTEYVTDVARVPGATRAYGVGQLRNEVVVIDTVTLTATARPLAPGACPEKAVWSADLLWYVDACSHELFAWDPATATTSGPLVDAWQIDELLAAPGDPTRLWWRTNRTVTELAVGGGPDGPRASVTAPEVAHGWYDAAISADGTRLFLPGTRLSSDAAEVLETETYLPVDHYPGEGLMAAVDVRPDGTVAVAGVDHGAGRHSAVFVYRRGESTAAARIPREVGSGGLALGRERVFAVRGSRVESWRVVPPRAVPTGTRVLDRATLFDVVGDRRLNRWYLTPGPSGSGLAVVDGEGQVEQVVEGLPSASQVALDVGGGRLFVMLPLLEAVATLDLATLEVAALQPVGSLGDGYRGIGGLAWSQGRLWFEQAAALGSLDPDTGEVDYVAALPSGYSGARLHRVPGADGVLLHAAREGVTRIEVTGGPEPTALVTHQALLDRNGPVADLDVTPDGRHAVVAVVGQEEHVVLDTTDLSEVARRLGSGSPTGVSVRRDGLTAFASGFTSYVNEADFLGPALRLAATPLGPWVDRKQVDGSRFGSLALNGTAFARRDLLGATAALRPGTNEPVSRLTLWRMPRPGTPYP